MRDEIGEELTLKQLEPKTVVLLRASHRPELFITAWFCELNDKLAIFELGEIRTTFAARVRNGRLFDGMNHQIHVYRYKGEV